MNKYNIINLYKKRSESFMRRTVSLLEKIGFASDYDKEIQEFYGSLPEAGYDEISAISNYEASLAEEYMLLSDGIYSAALTAFFHLWERDIRDLCKRLSRHRPVDLDNKPVTVEDIPKYKYDRLKKLLIFWGAEETMFKEINLLRILVNTIKHGTGTSANELLEYNSKYYRKLWMLCELEPNDCEGDETETLNIYDLKYFGSSVTTFWMNLGKNISI